MTWCSFYSSRLVKGAYFILWLVGTCCNGRSSTDASAEVISIVSEETEAYYQQDFERWMNCFVQDSSFRMCVYWEGWPEKVKYYRGFDQLRDEKKAQFEEDRTLWKSSYEVRSDEQVLIDGNLAWYSFTQMSFESGTGEFLGKSLENRVLVRRGNKWRIAYLGYHYYPTTDETANLDTQSSLLGSHVSSRRN